MKTKIAKEYTEAKKLIENGVKMLYKHQPACDVFLENISHIVNNTNLKNRKLKDVYGRILTMEDCLEIENKLTKVIREELS